VRIDVTLCYHSKTKRKLFQYPRKNPSNPNPEKPAVQPFYRPAFEQGFLFG